MAGQKPAVAEAMLPKAVSEEIVRRYADVLRVGRLVVNGRDMEWDTDKSTEMQLRSFCSSLFTRLSEVLPDLAKTNPEVLRFTAYWYCKAVSINYALIEVLLMIKEKVGVLCTIETRETGVGSLVEYVLEAAPRTNLLRVSLRWRKDNNIVYRDPEKSECQVKGSLWSVATEFSLPPKEGFLPAYCLQMRLRKSLAARFASSLACASSKQTETVCIDKPLRSDHPLKTYDELSALPHISDETTGPTCSTVDGESPVTQARRRATSECSVRHSARCPPRPGSPQAFTALEHFGAARDNAIDDSDDVGLGNKTMSRQPLLEDTGDASELVAESRLPSTTSWLLGEDCLLDSPNSLVGDLRIRILRARTVPEATRTSVLNTPDRSPELYATCLLAGRIERTRTVSDGGKPEWLEAWTFAVRGQDLRDDILIELFDNGMYGACDRLDYLGRVTVPVSRALSDSGPIALTEALRNGVCGSIDLELELLPRASFTTPQARSDEEHCSIEVGPTIPVSMPTATMPPPGPPITGVSVKVHSASPVVSVSRSLWCTKACAADFS
mmetsp:Transcript_5538/g.8631  ORF Transcript_5538/g.8631 Transcript_5538/m.8631 type:complete len:555 (+) Transcript_5538:87-1751(+)